MKQGFSIGKTDEMGFNITESPIHVHDIQATILHCLGLDHKRLAVTHQGLPVRLTGVQEHSVVKSLLA